jgi:small basic protein (TIGR04137 family)
MSMDTSLKSKSTLQRHRNVLSRAERIAVLKEIGLWSEGKATGLPKVAHRKAAVGKKDKADKKVEGAPGAEGAAAAPAADAKAAGGKPAAGAKAAAPAAKPAAKGKG